MNNQKQLRTNNHIEREAQTNKEGNLLFTNKLPSSIKHNWYYNMIIARFLFCFLLSVNNEQRCIRVENHFSSNTRIE